MTPLAGHNHMCWVKTCKQPVHYFKGVWFSFCEEHLRLNNLGPFRVPITHNCPDDGPITGRRQDGKSEFEGGIPLKKPLPQRVPQTTARAGRIYNRWNTN